MATNRKSQLNREVLASYLSDLLNLPRDNHGRCTKGRQIINAILKAMTDALHRGETVYVKGWGTMWVAETGRRVFKPGITQTTVSPVFVEYPSRKRVRFKPTYKARNKK